MVIVSLSKIQLRRGQKNITGLPQLSSAELAWCIDTQELFIGNGSISEGSPTIGNTRILTENDIITQNNIFNLAQYYYNSDSVNTTIRTLQSVMDDNPNILSFGLHLDGTSDSSTAIQNAINYLYLNQTSQAYLTTAQGVNKRIKLILPPGIFSFTKTILIPSYLSLVGAGEEKTILHYTGTTGSAFQFINDSYIIGNNTTVDITSTLSTNQPKNIIIKDLTIINTNVNTIIFQLDAVKYSRFENINFSGAWTTSNNDTSKALLFNSVNSNITCYHNIFKNIKINGFNYGIYSDKDILNNYIDTGYIYNCNYGVGLGITTNGTTSGQQYGPIETSLNNIKFENIYSNAINITYGTKNFINNCSFVNVGNTNQSYSVVPQIYISTTGNIVKNIISDRILLSNNSNTTTYIPEVTGNIKYDISANNNLTISYNTSSTNLFRLPISTDASGNIKGTTKFNVEYMYQSSMNFSRCGNLIILSNGSTYYINDNYIYVGSGYNSSSPELSFTVTINNNTLMVSYTNILSSDSGVLSYTYTSTVYSI